MDEIAPISMSHPMITSENLHFKSKVFPFTHMMEFTIFGLPLHENHEVY